MEEKNKVSFEEIFDQNKRRIHYQLHKLNIHDSNGEFFQEGLVAMWNAYERYQPDKGPMSTYFNFMIRNRIIDSIRKQNRDKEHEAEAVAEHITRISDGNHQQQNGMQRPIPNVSELLIDDPQLWRNLKAKLTRKSVEMDLLLHYCGYGIERYCDSGKYQRRGSEELGKAG